MYAIVQKIEGLQAVTIDGLKVKVAAWVGRAVANSIRTILVTNRPRTNALIVSIALDVTAM
jgi:hypothetical protein